MLEDRFVYIRYKKGLLFQKLGHLLGIGRDEIFWAEYLFGWKTKLDILNVLGYPYLTSFLIDINPHWAHNLLSKNILGLNQLRNAVLATSPKHSCYFMETISCYASLSPYHEAVLDTNDEFSRHFVMHIPRVNVGCMSFGGNNQEDCVVFLKNLRAFDCNRLYTLRLLLEGEGQIVFYPVKGDPCDEFLGTLSMVSGTKFEVTPQSLHIKLKKVSPVQYDLYFYRSGFRIL